MADANNNGEARDPALLAAHESMLEGLGQLADYFGFSKVMGQIYGALLLSPESLCLDDLTENLDVSKASVSTNIRTLEHMGMVRQVFNHKGGGRRKYYEAETDFWQIISNILAGREMRDVERALSVMETNSNRLSAAMDEMSEEEQELARLYLERITQIQALFRFVQLVMTSILSRVGDMDLEDISSIEIQASTTER